MGSYLNRAAALFAVMAFVLSAGEAFANAIVLTQAKAQAGGITPGDGPGFPITLSKSGSYIFESDILPSASVNGIEVTVPYVTIDFNGFVLHGGKGAFNAITTPSNALTVKNGTIAHFKFTAISAPTSYLIVENMHIIENGTHGVVTADYAKVTGSTISANGGSGIGCNDYCHIEGNVLSSNKAKGILLHTGSILGNTILNNGSYGIDTVGQSGYGNNTLVGNNGGGAQTLGGIILYRMQPNACNPACPWTRAARLKGTAEGMPAFAPLERVSAAPRRQHPPLVSSPDLFRRPMERPGSDFLSEPRMGCASPHTFARGGDFPRGY
jgi:hypothetical protein